VGEEEQQQGVYGVNNNNNNKFGLQPFAVLAGRGIEEVIRHAMWSATPWPQ